jgi:hypothetical protein
MPCVPEKSGNDGPLKFLAKRLFIEEHVRITELAVEAIFDMLDGLDYGLEVRITGENDECCAGLAIDASRIVEYAGRGDVFRTLRAEFICDVLNRSSFAVFLMRKAEDVMETVQAGVNMAEYGERSGGETLSK